MFMKQNFCSQSRRIAWWHDLCACGGKNNYSMHSSFSCTVFLQMCCN